MSIVKCTKDYSIFKKHTSNRDLSQENLKKIKRSMEARNMLEFRPILVDQHMRVLDGQHRLEAAKQLGIEIWYQINTDSAPEDIILLNANQKRWNRSDYLNYYRGQGNESYEKVHRFCEDHDVAIDEFLSLDPNYTRGSKKVDDFVLGKYNYPREATIVQMTYVLNHLKRIMERLNGFIMKNNKFTKSHVFKRALITFLNVDGVDPDVFIKKLEYKLDGLHGCADVVGYLQLFQLVYNWRNSNPIEV